jgi:glutathione synthase/RimK-type ligase-like ATP-grasp enzyme
MKDGEKLNITKFSGTHLLVRLHPSVGAKLKLSQGFCTCVCGIQSMNVSMVSDRSVPESSVQISTGLSERLHMTSLPNWVTAYVEQQKLHFGPLIGILCNPVWNETEQALRRTRQLPSLEKLVASGTDAGVFCYLFRLQDVDFENAKTIGYTITEQGWQRIVVPLPNSIYDQVTSRKLEHSSKYADKRVKLSELYATRIFNDGFFDKLQVNEWLIKDTRLRQHMPMTYRYQNASEAMAFVQRFPTTFFKPVHGSLGLGIIRLTKHADGTVSYAIKRQHTAPTLGKVGSSGQAIRVIQRRLKSRPYLMQQGITLAAYHDRPFDIRILLQRDGKGSWRRTKMFARVAKAGDFTSNLSSGGEALPVDQVLQTVFPSSEKRRTCHRQIRNVSKLITDVIERESGKQFGELGVDVGVDENGDVWIIEVNSKPWKSATTEKGRQDLVDLAFQRPIQYAIYLAQQP